MRIELLGIEKLWSNSGQIDGLPANPRKWDANDVKRLAKSIEETPELLEARPPIVVPHDGFYIVLGGNMRLEACRYLDYVKIPCVVVDEGTPIETLKQIVVKDNSSFGEWDFSKLKDEWDEMPLGDWGVLGYDSYIKSLEKKETEKLSQLKFDTPYYQPADKPQISLDDCVDKTLFDAKVAFIEKSKLTKKQKAVMKLFAYRFLRIDFQSVADYYAFNATDEERQVLERLRLVLVDGGGIRGFVEDGLLKVAGLEAGDDGDE